MVGSPKACRFCGSKLNPGANFCTQCELFQSRFFRAKSTTIYFTVFNAIMASAILFYTTIIARGPNAGLEEDADPSFAGVKCYADRAFVTLVNRGLRPMAASRGSVTLSDLPFLMKGRDNKPQSLTLDPAMSSMIVKELGTSTVEFVYTDPAYNLQAKFILPEFLDRDQQEQCKYHLDIRYYGFKANADKPLSFRPSCPCTKVPYSGRTGERRAVEKPSEPSEAKQDVANADE